MDWGSRYWGSKLVYRLEIMFELEVYLISCGDARFVRKYSQLNLTLFLDYSNLNQNISFWWNIMQNIMVDLVLDFSMVVGLLDWWKLAPTKSNSHFLILELKLLFDAKDEIRAITVK